MHYKIVHYGVVRNHVYLLPLPPYGMLQVVPLKLWKKPYLEVQYDMANVYLYFYLIPSHSEYSWKSTLITPAKPFFKMKHGGEVSSFFQLYHCIKFCMSTIVKTREEPLFWSAVRGEYAANKISCTCSQTGGKVAARIYLSLSPPNHKAHAAVSTMSLHYWNT